MLAVQRCAVFVLWISKGRSELNGGGWFDGSAELEVSVCFELLRALVGSAPARGNDYRSNMSDKG